MISVKFCLWIVFVGVFCQILICCKGTQDVPTIRGVSPQDFSKYSANVFTCFDGSATLPKEKINDNFCDCEDGSDEPGTAACSFKSNNRIKFYCENKGYLPKRIPTNYVNDGFCDCCDGSDEYDSQTECGNTCKKEGEGIRREYFEKLEVIREGLRKKQENIQYGNRELKQLRQNLKDKQSRLASLEEELKVLDDQKQKMEKQEEIEKQLLREKKKKEKEEQKIEGEVKPQEQVNEELNQNENSNESPSNSPTEKKEGEKDEQAEKANNEEDDEEVKNFKNDVASKESVLESASAQFYNLLSLIKYNYYLVLQNIYGVFNKTEAQRARDAYDAKKKEVDALKSEVSNLETDASQDYGSENEFYYLKGKCIESDSKDYVYEMCPYGKSTQKDKRNSMQTSLGNWKKEWETKYTVMKFENGQSCWQGPNRSNTVTLKCGKEDKVIKTDEPSKCVYTMIVETPSACTLEQEGEVQQKLKNLE